MTTIALFATATVPYSAATAETTFQTQGVVEAMAYLRAYFAKTASPEGWAHWNPSTKSIQLIATTKLSHFIPKGKWRSTNGGIVLEIKPLDQVQKFELCVVSVDTSHGRTWEHKGTTFINLFGGWLHEGVTEPLAVPTPAVQLWLDHIRTVFANGSDTIYPFLVRWFARIAQRGKNEIALDLKSNQGTGKSIVFEFLRTHVFGEEVVHITDDPNVVVGDFNSALAARALLVLEEMPTASKGQFHTLSNRLKLLCTSSNLTINQKFKDKYTVKNTLSVAVLSNRDALCIEQTDRRYAVLDISDIRRGDVRYFEQLVEGMTNEVGLEFWRYLLSIDLKGHNDRTPPATEARREKKVDTMLVFYRWMKEEFLQPHKDASGVVPETGEGIPRTTFADFYQHFQDSNPFEVVHKHSKIAVSKLLTAIGITPKNYRFKGHRDPKKGIQVSYDELYRIFDKQGWIHETDEFRAATAATATVDMVPTHEHDTHPDNVEAGSDSITDEEVATCADADIEAFLASVM